MKILKGTSMADGLSSGKAVFISAQDIIIPKDKIAPERAEAELEAARRAFKESKTQLLNMLESGTTESYEQIEIISTHLDILDDPEIKDFVETAITKEYDNAAHAINEVFLSAVNHLRSLNNKMMAERAADFDDVRILILGYILKMESDLFRDVDEDSIPIFEEALPSYVSRLKELGVSGYITKHGGYTSHASILTRSLKISCVTNIPDLDKYISEGTDLLLDGESGMVVVDPDSEQLEFFAQKLQIKELIREKNERLRERENLTKDGIRVSLNLNISLPEELDVIDELNADGVGLFRTEFLFMGRDTLPSEEEQFQIYNKMAAQIAPKPLTIRTFDLGGDKLSDIFDSPHEENPNLGNRGIRFMLSHPQMLKAQLRAILRAAVHGNIRIMFPMVADVEDLWELRHKLKKYADELYYEDIPFNADVPIGTMIEIPSAALNSDLLARECDFLSIGTNDLVQYTLAVDRGNDQVHRFYIQHHPAVLKLIKMTADNALKHGKSISVCGEMASIPEYIPLLIGMGINELSLSASSYYKVKQVALNCDAKLRELIQNFDFGVSLSGVEDLIYSELKPYQEK
ncbi:MAG: phosphoenolpyruvate--protein phosphotransferase [Candidatus Cloacimonetes bacterium]|nr:phosphoenolpyruvate--protein phosphotransferase [Candidatus Cloacimonadota bacterium]